MARTGNWIDPSGSRNCVILAAANLDLTRTLIEALQQVEPGGRLNHSVGEGEGRIRVRVRVGGATKLGARGPLHGATGGVGVG